MVGGETLGTVTVSALKEHTDVSQSGRHQTMPVDTVTKVITHPNVKQARPVNCPCQSPVIQQILYTRQGKF